MNNKQIAKLLGSQGGKKTLEIYGLEHFKKASALGVAARMKKRKRKSGDNQPLAKKK